MSSLDRKQRIINIIYFGKYTENIGPPKSMYSLAKLLANKSIVHTSDNLKNSKITSAGFRVNNKIAIIENFRKILKGRLSNLNLLRYVFIENFRLLTRYRKSNREIIIVTQPFLFRIFESSPIIYIRRANLPISETHYTGILGLIEKNFLSMQNIHIVYLVKQTEHNGLDYFVIPNHFNLSDFELRYCEGRDPGLHSIGTWCRRKGSDILLENADALIGHLNSELNVYGNLGDDTDLNAQLINSPLNYHGCVMNPFNELCVGDVFISFSRLEGLQRSLVEAMLQGCLILALDRDDTRGLKSLPGCFIAKHEDLHNELNNLARLSKLQREKYGLMNREWAAREFSKSAIEEKWEGLFNWLSQQ